MKTEQCKEKRMRKHTISQTDKAAYTLFTDALPYYWDTWESLPAGLRFSLMINGYGSAAMACVDIVNHRLSSPGLTRDARKRLIHMQAWKKAKSLDGEKNG